MTLPTLCRRIIATALFAQFSSAQTLITLPHNKDGAESQAIALPLDTEGHYVTVGVVDADVTKATAGEDKFTLVVQDSQSRCTLLKGPKVKKVPTLGSSKYLNPGSALYQKADQSGSLLRVVSRETYFHDQLLPLQFLRISYNGTLPKPGQPLYDKDGKLVALAHQPTSDFGTGIYALPIEAITRNLEDYRANKTLKRCWLGLHLDHLNQIPLVEGVRPESPSSKVGLQKGDVLLSLGDWPVTTYSSAINAFYYLLPGQQTDLRILRGTKVLDLKITPVAHPTYSAVPSKPSKKTGE
ncbi:S1C family serine protease [Akkermansiaceae bacterium]|nr:S1C family serine protease [Akkermansiaceae bacterium]MDB4568316.1 S1C family serine protease [Akkermansiaceae bacterium]